MKDGYIRVGAATPDVLVGDIDHNVQSIYDLVEKAVREGVSLLVFPELSITGYTCQDMFLHKSFTDMAFDRLKQLASWTEKYEICRRKGKGTGSGIHRRGIQGMGLGFYEGSGHGSGPVRHGAPV